ncbi:DUF4249 family protein [Mangrovivirga cuniculi]|uniref:DUF4249 domain-containing protein n=1 Tax=Mangrovivirga cuniculi TaxID=2715131 RepID=A0A4D7JNL6_9BACT|nr:DUF4249 family protein [Mangrovivirga cuniculi]QCK15090.1 hypothetical protein DCC35_10185 [Mangrovivirga cuniculi]
MRILIFIISIILIQGCLPEPLEVDNIPPLKKQPVITTVNFDGTFLNLIVTQNFTVESRVSNDNIDSLIESLLIEDLEITITTDEQQFLLTEYVDGIYFNPEIPGKPGNEYKLSFPDPYTSDTVKANSILMEKISFSELETSLLYTEFDTLLNIEYTINDPLGKNFYMINVQRVTSDYYLLKSPYVELIEDNTDSSEHIISSSFIIPFEDFASEDTILVSLSNIEKNYFDYLKQKDSQRLILIDELSEPINYNSNVINGLGFFTLFQPDIELIRLE